MAEMQWRHVCAAHATEFECRALPNRIGLVVPLWMLCEAPASAFCVHGRVVSVTPDGNKVWIQSELEGFHVALAGIFVSGKPLTLEEAQARLKEILYSGKPSAEWLNQFTGVST